MISNFNTSTSPDRDLRYNSQLSQDTFQNIKTKTSDMRGRRLLSDAVMNTNVSDDDDDNLSSSSSKHLSEEINKNPSSLVDIGVTLRSRANKRVKNLKYKDALLLFDQAYKSFQSALTTKSLHNKSNLNSLISGCLIDQATCYFELKEFPKAMEKVDESIKFTPKSQSAYLLKYRIYFSIESYQNALKALKQALQIKPSKTLMNEYKDLEVLIMNNKQTYLIESGSGSDKEKEKSKDRCIDIENNPKPAKFAIIKWMIKMIGTCAKFSYENKWLILIIVAVTLVCMKKFNAFDLCLHGKNSSIPTIRI